MARRTRRGARTGKRTRAVWALAVLAAARPAPAGSKSSWHWQVPPGLATPVLSVAAGSRTGALAVGDARGVLVRPANGVWRRRPTPEPAVDLAFGQTGELWIATPAGLLELPPGGEPGDRTPAPAETARDVRRVAVSGAYVAVATAAGVYWRGYGGAWHELDSGVRLSPATAVVWETGPAGRALWAAGAGDVVRLPDPGRGRAERVGLPRPGLAVVDLAAGWGGAALALLTRRGLALRYGSGPGASWTWVRTAWPPGVEPRRLGAAAGRLWIATDRGLLEALGPRGPWRRARPPAGRAQVFAVAEGGPHLYAAAAAGLLVARPTSSTAREPGERDQETLDCGPPVAAVHRVALGYTRLEPARVAALGAGLRSRGLVPEVTLRGGYEAGRDWGRDRDEAFVSGALRRLLDHGRDQSRDFEVALTLHWDLPRRAYDPEQVDLSQEARRLVELRDDVLDEINQLYFERLGLLEQLARGAPPTSKGLALRVHELTAGLDAWTGGWFGAHAACSPPPPVP